MLGVFFLFLLCCGVHGDPKSLNDATTAITNLYDPVDVLWQNSAPTTYKRQITKIMRSFTTIYNSIDKLDTVAASGKSEFQQFLDFEAEGMDLFNIIMKLLYTQSNRARSEFTSLGGPNMRMYAFGIIGKTCARFGAIDNVNANNARKSYLYPHLLISDPPEGIYKPLDDVPISGLEEGELDDDPVDLEGPFIEAIETIEGQVYNFYNQWTANGVRFIRLEAEGKINTMNAIMQNILVTLDYIMSTDDVSNSYLVAGQVQGVNFANWIYFFEHNRVVDIIELLADLDEDDEEREKIVTYANFLLYTYFITPDVAVAQPDNRFETTAYDLQEVAKFTPLRN